MKRQGRPISSPPFEGRDKRGDSSKSKALKATPPYPLLRKEREE